MLKYRNSQDTNHRFIADQKETLSAIAIRIGTIISERIRKDENISHVRCPKCNSITSHVGIDILDLNEKLHFCEAENRRLHEEEWVIRLLKLVDDCDRTEFSSFQVELNSINDNR